MQASYNDNSYGYPSLVRYPDQPGRMSGFIREIFLARGWIEPAPGNRKVLYVTDEGKRHIQELGLNLNR